ncbi:acyl-CoA--6-aminopenicillanic acid acyl transferase [Spirochaetia bacterium]|nr:acyl-CoA--6-aminopenicillanic acid acyl transferase [Spirochaetia bacterium]
MSTTIQVRVDDELKAAADTLYASMGFDTSTAIRMFLTASLQENGIPFALKRRLNAETLEAMEDVRLRRNLHGPYENAAEMIEALESDDA